MIARIHDLFNNTALRKTFLKIRLPLGLVFLILIATQIKPAYFFPGLALSVLGELFQVWCLATIKTKKKLTVVGPYMFMRNPMYVGRFFQLFGIIMMTGNAWFMLAFAVLYYFYMINRVKREEKVLLALFGNDYEEYCRNVNRYLPSLKKFDRKLMWSFDKESFRQNHAAINILATGICYMILYIVAFHW